MASHPGGCRDPAEKKDRVRGVQLRCSKLLGGRETGHTAGVAASEKRGRACGLWLITMEGRLQGPHGLCAEGSPLCQCII